MQELNNCIIDKTELTGLIVGGDWNCTLSRKEKLGGTAWAPTNYRNLVLTIMDMFDLIDIQRVRHPRLQKFTYESKACKMKSRIDLFLIAKNLTNCVKTTDVFPSIAPDHNAIYVSLLWENEPSRGPGFISTISYTKHKAKISRAREMDIKNQLEELDNTICNNFSSPDINQILQKYDDLKTELRSLYENKGKEAMSRAKCRWVENGERPTKYFFNMEKRNYNKKTINELRLPDESTSRDEKQILDQIETYFKKLYTSEELFSEEKHDEFIQGL